MKVTVQHYNEDPKQTKSEVIEAMKGSGLTVQDVAGDMQHIECSADQAKKVIEHLSPIENIQTQTA